MCFSIFSGRCPYWKQCGGYTQDTYTCDYSHDEEAVKRYIQEQQGKDVFEYDIYGCPDRLKGQLKIGDFS
jgi:hypothetical protein